MKKNKTTYVLISWKPFTLLNYLKAGLQEMPVPTTYFSNENIQLCSLQHPKNSRKLISNSQTVHVHTFIYIKWDLVYADMYTVAMWSVVGILCLIFFFTASRKIAT